MNDYYAVEPVGFGGVSELRRLLSGFGVFKGSYIVDVPNNWAHHIREATKSWSDLERKKVTSLLEKLRKEYGVFSPDAVNLAYDNRKEWIQNIASQSSQLRNLSGVVVEKQPDLEYVELISTAVNDRKFVSIAENFEHPISHNKYIRGNPKSMAGLCEIILKTSAEVYFIDPYLNLGQEKCRAVMQAMLEATRNGKCQKFLIFARKKDDDVREKIRHEGIRLLRSSKNSTVKSLEIFLCDDGRVGDQKMHARYVFGARGGLKFDKGFQTMNYDMDISIMSPQVLEDQFRKFSNKEFSFDFEQPILIER